ncbi:hypothetical protein DMUE_2483 [Dictyocoela muelleri]|nr:hypothetical protein DMUE_2483 [Dictyocoela muelleri]
MLSISFVPNDKKLLEYENFKKLYLKKFSEKSDIEILKFFEINYINNQTNEISDWDCSERVLKGIQLTTNICEGFNRSLNALFKSCHPNLIKLIITLRTQDHLQD